MLLRVRVTLPDRPGALGQVARTLGVAGADIVQVVVLERLGGRAVDDFTVVWPGSARLDRLMAGLMAIPGVRVDGVWRAIGAPVAGGHDSELLAQVAGNPTDGLATLVDAVPGLLAADWAATVVVSPDWAARSGLLQGIVAKDAPELGEAGYMGDRPLPGVGGLGELGLSGSGEPAVAYASWRAPAPLHLPEVTPLRARAVDGPDGTRYAAAPFGRAGLVLVVARVPGDDLPAAAFHVTEVERVAQLVRAAAVVLGDHLDRVTVPSRS
ncbi:MAG TPA: amino acid-binding protein [Pilimelia sp.]|nr:amino acid-binding protein [Pilimelia sp.]